jgi:two-component system CheB/CheR fusion protein
MASTITAVDLTTARADHSVNVRFWPLADIPFKRTCIEPPKCPAAVKNASLSDLLDVLVRAVIEERNGEARAAFYMAEEGKLHHVTGMPKAYAKCVDGFAISPQSLACGLAASTGQAIITRDVIEEPLWKPWLWLAKQFDYRGCWSFPVKTSSGNIVGTFAMYFKEPREATDRDLDFAATIARTAAIAMSRPHPSVQ